GVFGIRSRRCGCRVDRPLGERLWELKNTSLQPMKTYTNRSKIVRRTALVSPDMSPLTSTSAIKIVVTTDTKRLSRGKVTRKLNRTCIPTMTDLPTSPLPTVKYLPLHITQKKA